MIFFHPKISLPLDQGRFSDAEDAIRAELAESIDDPYLYYLLGVSLLCQGKPKDAEKAAREAISFRQEMDLGYFGLSRALLE